MAKQPDPWRSLTGEIAALKVKLADLARRSPFFGTGMHPNGENGLDSDNFEADVSGYRLAETPEFNDIKLRGGIIGNDALTSPTSPQAPYDYVTGFSVPYDLTNLRTLTLPVPSGFTKAAVSLTVRIYAVNNTAGLDYLYSQANINGYNGLALPVAASANNGSCMNVSTFAAVLSGSALGSNLVLQAVGGTEFGAWGANASNQLDMSAMIVWYR